MPLFSKRTMFCTGVSATAGPWIPLNQYPGEFSVSFGVQVSAGDGMEQWRVEHTFDNVFDSSVTPQAFIHAQATAIRTGLTDGNYVVPIAAIRIAYVSGTAATSGNATYWVRQTGI